ncbi:tyrosine-protein kinase JAK2-like [Tropilaelaps mercedesae]|uniref:Tyrosine-protein kinase JAK2-like n=1 Tax=Tropilaelaps mercedesae TaxID=418985 RepID=A0A1V9X6C9_9ACAR|nr:tyrosine-protein kinase JAK2-like [Tropilaelaps mercedesae]
MSSDSNNRPEVVVDLCVPTLKPFQVSSHDAYLVDDLNQRACELAGIPPTFRFLTALFDLDRKMYLVPEDTIGGDSKGHQLQLRIRYHPASLDPIMGTPTMDLYYHQLRYRLLNGYTGHRGQNTELENKLFGLLVNDYVRQLVEKGDRPEGKTVDDLIGSTFPANCKFPWWKKHIVGKEFMQKVQIGFDHSNNDLVFIKCNYIEEIWNILEEFRQEKFAAQIFVNGSPYKCDLIVGQLGSSTEPGGPGLRIVHESDSRHVFLISQLCYLSLDGAQVEMHIMNKQPINIILQDERRVKEFLCLLDGYYRMTEKFMASLCGQTQHPTLVSLKRNRIHGPIPASVARKKLFENESRQGCYLVRQSQTHYRTYLVDLLLSNEVVETRTIVETPESNFRLDRDHEDSAFKTIPALVKARLRPAQDLYQLPPSEYDRTGLQFCRPTKGQSDDDAGERNEKETLALVLDPRKIHLETTLRSTVQQKVIQGRFGKKSVVVRFVGEIRYIQHFLNKANEVLKWKSREIVPVLGITIVSPVGLVSEYMPLGSLDMFLMHKGDELSIGDLGDASLCLAKAVWYLEESGLVHGKIRCRSAFVAECAQSSFKVKLGEPGLLSYDDRDIPWIAPEYLSVKDSVAYSLKADLYALGTTLWEIFHHAKDPFKFVPMEEARKFFAEGKRLSLADVPQEFCAIVADCWHSDPDERRSPRSIVRDIHQLLYQIYLPRKYNTYTDLDINSTVTAPLDSPEAPELPPLRAVPQRANDGLQRRPSATSQSSLASHRNWLSLFRSKKEYDTLSNVTSHSAAVSEQTIATEVTDAATEDDYGFMDSVDAVEINSEDWVIERKDLKLGNPLGQGFFGMVFEATLTRYSGMTEEQVAVKRMKSSVSEFSQKDLEREIEIMKTLRHPNIVEIKGICEEPEVLLVMEYLELGSLQMYLQVHKERLSHAQLIKFGYDIANAMAYLERKRIIHRDLAARNILVKSKSSVKISDFGLAHIVDREYYTIQTMHRNLPIKWYAPESILYGKFSIKSDVWSYGVALWEMFAFGDDPMPNDCDNLASLGEKLMAGHRLPLPKGCPADVYQIMRECWRSDHNLRPTFATLLDKTKNLADSTGWFDGTELVG